MTIVGFIEHLWEDAASLLRGKDPNYMSAMQQALATNSEITFDPSYPECSHWCSASMPRPGNTTTQSVSQRRSSVSMSP